jgi:hypothetical protein
MAAVTEDDHWQIKTGIAGLVSFLVRALEKSNPSIRAHTLEILSEDYSNSVTIMTATHGTSSK